MKLAPDRYGPVFDPSHGERIVDPESVRLARRYLGRRFPDLAESPVIALTGLPVRDDPRHALHPRSPPGPRQRLDRRRRLGPCLQARAGHRVAPARPDRRDGADERGDAVRARPRAGAQAEHAHRRGRDGRGLVRLVGGTRQPAGAATAERVRGADLDLGEDRGLVRGRGDPLDLRAVDDDRPDVPRHHVARDVVGDRRVGERHHRFASGPVLRIDAPRQVQAARGRGTARPGAPSAGWRGPAAASRAARSRADDGEQVAALDGDRVDADQPPVLERLEGHLDSRNRSWPLRKSDRRSPNMVSSP